MALKKMANQAIVPTHGVSGCVKCKGFKYVSVVFKSSVTVPWVGTWQTLALNMERPEKLLLDMSGIIDDETLHEYLSKKLNFPGYYGYNFDAFWDCITDEEQSSMPNVLVVEGLAVLRGYLPKELEKLISCLKDHENEYPDRRVIYEEGSPSGEGIEFED